MSGRHQTDESPLSQVNELHVHGVVSIVLELCLCLENLLPIFVVIFWRRPRERTVSDKLIASLSAIYVLSALLPTPLGLASYFHGSWYGGAATCECFQVKLQKKWHVLRMQLKKREFSGKTEAGNLNFFSGETAVGNVNFFFFFFR